MRVLIATEHAGIVGGVETYLRAVIPRLAAAGVEVGVLTEIPRAEAGIVADATGVPRWSSEGRSVEKTLATLDPWKPDVVYSHGLADARLEAVLAVRYPTIAFAHNYSGTCVSGTKCYVRPVAEPCERVLGPGCLTAYFPRRCGGRNPLTALGLYRTQRRRNRALGDFRAVLVASRHMAGEMIRNGVPAERVHHLPLFPTDSIPDHKPPPPRPRSNRILFVGRLTALKGLSHLIRALPVAAATLGRRLSLVVAGDGPEREKCEAEARCTGIDAEFLGWVDGIRREHEMRKADLLAVPSVWPEPFGLVGIEAGCVGLPAVAYEVGGIPDWLEPGICGESAPGRRPDPMDLASAIVRALADPTHWQKLRVGAWEVAGRFKADRHVRDLKIVLEAVAQSDHPDR